MKYLSHLRLLESKDPQGKDWDIVVIEAGLGKNDRFYSPEVLHKATPLYKHVPVYLFKLGDMADHLPDDLADQKQRLVGNQVGWLEDPHFSSFKAAGKSKQGILARLHIDEGFKNLRAKLLDAWNHGLKTLYGLSHDAGGNTTKDKATGIETVDEINEVSSVELVTYPAQGGQFVRLLASQGGNIMFPELAKTLLGILTKLEPSLVEGLDADNITEDQLLEMADALHEKDEFYTEAQALEAKGPFMRSVIAKLITLLKGDKKDQALKVLTELQAKLKDYTYPSPAKDDKTKDSEVITLEDLFPADVDESAYTECMKTQMKAGKSMKDAAKICKVTCKKKESGDGHGDGDSDKDVKAAVARITKVEEDIKKSQSAAILEQVLTASDLFEPVKEKVRKQFADRIFEKKDLEESLKQEKDVLAKLSESGNLKGLGQSRVQVTLDESDKHQIAMDLLFENEVKDPKGVSAFRGIKEAYRQYNPHDQAVTFQRRRPKRLSEATMITTDFDNALGTSMMRKMLKIYKLLELPWREFVNIVPVDNFKQQERIRWGGFGEIPTVLQEGEYKDIGFPTDEKATYTPLKKGGLFSISREVIKNDDLNMLRQVPRRLARAAARTLASFIWAFLINNSTIYDGAALFTAARGNLGASALDFDTLSAAVTALKGMREKGNYKLEGTVDSAGDTTLVDADGGFGVADAYVDHYVRIVYGPGVGQYRKIASHTDTTLTISVAWTTNPEGTSKYEVFQHLDEKIGLKPAHVAIPTELEPTLDIILNSKLEPGTVENNINVMKGVAKKMTPPNLVDPNDWYVIADKTWLDLFEIGFIDGQQNPTILIQDQPGVGTVFTRDRITYKLRHEYGGAPVDYRGFYKAVVG